MLTHTCSGDKYHLLMMNYPFNILEFHLIAFCWGFLLLYSWVILASIFLVVSLSGVKGNATLWCQGNDSFTGWVKKCFFPFIFCGRVWDELVFVYLTSLIEFTSEVFWSWAFFVGRLFITDLISLLVIGLVLFSISSWVGFGNLWV